jgi:hypothetical protein
MKPVVVSTADRREQPAVKPGDRHDQQAAAGIKHRKIQTLAVHGAENADPVVVASLDLGVVLVLEIAGVVPALASDSFVRVPDDLPLHHHAKPASDIGQAARRPILEPGIDVAFPKIRRLKYMKVGVYSLKPIFGHLSTPLRKCDTYCLHPAGGSGLTD